MKKYPDVCFYFDVTSRRVYTHVYTVRKSILYYLTAIVNRTRHKMVAVRVSSSKLVIRREWLQLSDDVDVMQIYRDVDT